MGIQFQSPLGGETRLADFSRPRKHRGPCVGYARVIRLGRLGSEQGLNRAGRVSRSVARQPQIIPGAGVTRIAFHGFLQLCHHARRIAGFIQREREYEMRFRVLRRESDGLCQLRDGFLRPAQLAEDNCQFMPLPRASSKLPNCNWPVG